MLTISRERGAVRPGAHRFQRLLNGLNLHSMASAPTILVTGTNGKGTVCAFLESALREARLRTALYTSPHLVSVTERVRTQGLPVSESDFKKALMLVEAQVPSSLPNASEFEILSAAAALVFHSQPVDVAIVEIGLGGLFDSTNACEPAVSVLTSVGLDHTEFLGSTLEAIARDKAYISRRNQPLVVGELSPNALQAASETTRITGARIAHYNTLSRRWDCVFHEIMNRANSWISANAQNLCVALKALEEFEVQIQSPLCTSDIVSGVLHTVWPGRFDERTVGNRTFVFDGAHNEQGFHFFEKQFAQSEYSQTKPLFIYASLSDKPWQVIIPNLHRLASRIIFTEVRSERAVQAQNLLKFATERLPKHHHSHAPNVREALAMALAAPTTAPIFIVGSLALVGEAMENLSVDPFEKLRGHA